MNLHFEMKSQKKIADQLDETHAGLQEQQVAYQELIQQSVRLTRETDELAESLKSQSEEIAEQRDEQSELKRMARLLESKTTQLGESLHSRLAGLTATIKAMETRFGDEIATVAKASESRDQALSERIEQVSINTTAAVNELYKRFTAKTDQMDSGLQQANHDIETLFGSSRELAQHTGNLQQQIGVVDVRTAALETRADELEDRAEQQQTGTETLSNASRRRFQWVTASLMVLLLLVGIVGYFQSINWDQEAVKKNQLAEQLTTQNQIVQKNSDELVALESHSASLHAFQVEMQKAMDTELMAQQEKINQLQEKTKSIEDKSDSANGRISAMAPHRQFGEDNVIHGPAWLSKQNPDSYVIELRTVSEKSALYQTAQRWSHYLKENLAYYETESNSAKQYVLVYGVFSDIASARSAGRVLPAIDPWNRSQVKQLRTLNAKI
ncbi:SPOR domain-containing protein [Solemya velesiana gill symbiont]|uniref:SPOR domain-containing protein n=1 Tax=Solemya velesiana gill symbiont TaxID=1918948 RepID=A0A1T2KT96_9GAMM|nr:hypothetical protein [Solemya velesiana gill symbiont]OOZ36064.1 hypothetical protein BOW51_09070 [Solemya velesiana gill symbiont]